MKQMTIGKKISLACVVLVALNLIMGAVSVFNTRNINTDLALIVEGSLPGIYSLGVMNGYIKDEKIAMLEHLASEDQADMARIEAKIADLEIKLQAEGKQYEKTIHLARGRVLYDGLAPAHERFNRVWATILPLSRAAKTQEALAMWKAEAMPASAERAKVMAELSEFKRSTGEESGKSAEATSQAALVWSGLILVISLISGGLLAFFIVRSINKVLTQAVANLSEGAEQVSSASGQVSGSSQSLAQGASEQAASLEETSASSEEMASMTRKNAENSQQAAQFMNTVSQRVVEANGTLGDMITSMQEIGASSGKISKIIKVIDEIAFQTNILALNAAVEAARAGEAGMGFAVVADEVRNLAQRSAQAAKDTASLIEDSILKSTEGSKKLSEVVTSIQAITEGTDKVKTLVDEVDASSKEQAQGIEQISKAVAQMDEVTQRNAANAEESASASEQLNAQSQALMAVVGQLQELVGTVSRRSTVPRKPVVGKQTPVARSVRSNRVVRSAKASHGPTTPATSGARSAVEFPLDDSEFKEF